MNTKPPKPRSATDAHIPITALTQADVTKVAGKGRADLRPDQFKQMIQDKGYHLIWRKALLCTCFNKESGQSKPDCTVCDSSGYFYIEPIAIQGVMSNLDKRKDVYRNLGEWLEGSSMVTTAPENRLGFRDSLAMVHSVMVFNEYITKGSRRGVRRNLPANHDICRYRVVTMLHLMYELDGRPATVQKGIHFEIDSNGWIKWLPRGQEILDGTVFSAHYEFHPVWIVINHPHGVRDTIVKNKSPYPIATALPVQAAVKLDYLVSTEALPSSEVGIATG